MQALNDYVAIQEIDVEEVSESGLIVTAGTQRELLRGEVVSGGTGLSGEVVLCPRAKAIPFALEGVEYFAVNQEDLLVKL